MLLTLHTTYVYYMYVLVLSFHNYAYYPSDLWHRTRTTQQQQQQHYFLYMLGVTHTYVHICIYPKHQSKVTSHDALSNFY